MLLCAHETGYIFKSTVNMHKTPGFMRIHQAEACEQKHAGRQTTTIPKEGKHMKKTLKKILALGAAAVMSISFSPSFWTNRL